MVPPTASIASAICSAVRVFVPFSSAFAIKLRDAVGLRRFRQQPAAKNRRHGNQRQPRIFAHQQAQAIREFDLLHLARATTAVAASACAASEPFGLSETIVRLSSVRYFVGDAPNVVERHFLDGGQIVAA